MGQQLAFCPSTHVFIYKCIWVTCAWVQSCVGERREEEEERGERREEGGEGREEGGKGREEGGEGREEGE